MPTLILRPVADTDLKHSLSSGSSGWALISESVADGESSYIYDEIAKNKTSSKTSVFKVSGSVGNRIRISTLKLNINAKVNNDFDKASLAYNLYFNGIEGSSGSNNLSKSFANYGKTYNASDFGLADTIFDSFDAANLQVHIQTSLDSDKDNSLRCYVTQMYLEVTYEDITLPSYTCTAVNAGNTSVSVSKSSVLQGEQVTFNATPNTGCTFDGWYSDSACTSASKVSSSPSYTVTVNNHLTLYAKSNWIMYQMNIGAQPQDGTASVNKSTAHYGEQVTFTCNVTHDNREFYGWYSDAACTNLVSSNNPYTITVSGAVTLYPKIGAIIREVIIRPTNWWSAENDRSLTKDYNVPSNVDRLYTNTSSSTTYATLSHSIVTTCYNDVLFKMDPVYNGTDRLAAAPENANILDLYLTIKMQGASKGTSVEVWSNLYTPPADRDHDESHMSPRGTVWNGTFPSTATTVNIPKTYFSEVTMKDLKSGRFFIELRSLNTSTYAPRLYCVELHVKYSIPDNNCTTEALSDGNTVVDTSTDLTEAGKTCTWTAIPNPGYRFVGWFSDLNYTKLVSSDPVYTATVTAYTLLCAKSVEVARIISTEIDLAYGDASSSFTYKDADGTILTPGGTGVVQDSAMAAIVTDQDDEAEINALFASVSTTSKIRGILNPTKRNALFPNDTAHPVFADISCSTGRGNYSNTSSTPVKEGYYRSSDWVAPCFNDNPIIEYRPRHYDPIDYDHTDIRNDAILSANRGSDFELVINGNINNAHRYIVIERFYMKLYFEEYDFAALAGSSADGIRTVSVDKSIGHEGDSVTFSASLKSGAVWKGWYSDAACTHKVSDQQNYTCVPDAHTTLYALAITQETGNYLYFKRNGEWLEVNTVWKKVNGSWVELDEETARDILSNNNIKVIT